MSDCSIQPPISTDRPERPAVSWPRVGRSSVQLHRNHWPLGSSLKRVVVPRRLPGVWCGWRQARRAGGYGGARRPRELDRNGSRNRTMLKGARNGVLFSAAQRAWRAPMYSGGSCPRASRQQERSCAVYGQIPGSGRGIRGRYLHGAGVAAPHRGLSFFRAASTESTKSLRRVSRGCLSWRMSDGPPGGYRPLKIGTAAPGVRLVRGDAGRPGRCVGALHTPWVFCQHGAMAPFPTVVSLRHAWSVFT